MIQLLAVPFFSSLPFRHLALRDSKAEATNMKINTSLPSSSLFSSSFSARLSASPALRYLSATAAVLVAALVSRALTPLAGDRTVYILLFPTVAFSAWYCGIGPSISATALGLLATIYGSILPGFIPPLHTARTLSPADWIPALLFLFSAVAVIAMGETRRRHNEKLRLKQGALEARVLERTDDLATANQSLRELSARLLQLQDDERRHIARELHDSVGQMLAALTMNLSAVRLDVDRLTKTAHALEDSENLVQEMSTEVRTISHLLHPPLLDEAGLLSALRWYVEGFAVRSNIQVDLDLPDSYKRLPRESETAIFRVVQECLTNIHRHSGSSVATIRLRQRDHHVMVEIEDKGKGIPPEKREQLAAAGPAGVGIRGMRERLRQLGGRLEINSNGSGTVVTVRLPIPEASQADATTTADTSSPAAA
jgi:signal transduction histidine kinase